MRIVFVITGLSSGGAEMMLLKLLTKIDRSRFDPYVISLTTKGELGAKIEALNIPVDVMRISSWVTALTGFISLVAKLIYLRPDIVHTWMYHADLAGGIASRLAGIRSVVWCIRNSDLDSVNSRHLTQLAVSLCARLSKRIPSIIISCSRKAKEIHENLGYAKDKVVVIPNGFNLSQFTPNKIARTNVRNELGVQDDTPLIGLIGRYDPQKNHLGFLKAAKILHSRIPSAHFVLAGKGVSPQNAELAASVHEANLSPFVHLLGLRDDTPRLIASLDILVSASSYGEAFPNVIGEAMACEVFCVSTDVGDAAYILGGIGTIVPPRNMQKLADAMTELLIGSSKDRTESTRAGRERIACHFEIGAIVKRYEAVYDKVYLQNKSDPSD